MSMNFIFSAVSIVRSTYPYSIFIFWRRQREKEIDFYFLCRFHKSYAKQHKRHDLTTPFSVFTIHHASHQEVRQPLIYQSIKDLVKISGTWPTHEGQRECVTFTCRHPRDFFTTTWGSFWSSVIGRCWSAGLAHSKFVRVLYAPLIASVRCFFYFF